jgi:poly(3-hydroxybutyrate) depolymerase
LLEAVFAASFLDERCRSSLARQSGTAALTLGRIFSVGFSYGGITSDTIACQLGSTFRAIARIAGSMFGGTRSCVNQPRTRRAYSFVLLPACSAHRPT